MKISFRIIGQNIKASRLAVCLTQEQLAERLDISVIHYGRMERGEHRPSIEQLAKIADALNTSIEALLHGCIIDAKKHAAVFEAAENQTEGTAEYALVLLDEYREQLQEYIHSLKLRENALR